MTLLERVKARIHAVFTRTTSGEPPTEPSGEPPTEPSVEPSSEPGEAGIVPQQCPGSAVCTAMQRTILNRIARSSTSAQRLVTRSRLLLAYDQGQSKHEIATTQQVTRSMVQKWCRRWEQAQALLVDVESRGITETAYRAVIAEVLNDASRSGAPITFSAEAVTQIVAMACEILDDSDEAVSSWTHAHLAEEAVNREIVHTISRSSVGRFLREATLKPHQDRYWLNAPERNTPEFTQDVQAVCELYTQTPALHAQGIHVYSTDEKSGIQALERLSPTHAAQPGGGRSRELREHSYERHGTVCLIANFEVGTGRILSPSLGPTRTEADFVAHIKQSVAVDADGEWIFVADQLNTHQSESLVRFVAEQCGLPEELGTQGKHGILKSMNSRKAFLSDPSHRIRFVYTPKHTSWLNQIEIWFSILVRRLLKRGSFSSLEHLKSRIMKFIDFFNKTMAKAFKWTYTGRPLTV